VSSPTTVPLAASGATAIHVARRCAHEGGAIALQRFRGDRTVSVKGRGNVVTDADIAVELRIKEIIREEFPHHAVLSEETSSTTDPRRGWVWVIDPIDGTKNYSMGVPFWCVSVALCCDGEPVAGVTYDAVHNETFHAERGGGAFLDDAAVVSSDQADVQSSIIGVDLGYDDARGREQIALIGRIFPAVQTVRILGSAALGVTYAACGRLDLFTHVNLAPWDLAAGMLLVRESGGAIFDRAGAPATITSGTVVAGGRRVVADFLSRYGTTRGVVPDAASG
jgi:fructose-1,6-bisphosphatase/inositol monophosphatase family enzyme